MKNAATVQLVDRLQANKFVVREPASIDGRSTIIRLTKAGEAVLMKLVSLHLAQLARRKKQFGALFRQLKEISSE
jgi:DNA-binding MarR family transcriptional regulator